MYNRSVIDDNTIMKELKMAEKSLKKGLTKNVWRCILTELSARGTKQAADRMILENDTESRRARTAIFTSRSERDSQFVNEFWTWRKTSGFDTGFNTRVWSWLRTNAGGVPNTCKSSGDCGELAQSNSSGGRVSNAWATCLKQGDNASKDVLIPRKTTAPHGAGVKGGIRFEMGSRPIS